jgi:hypothetical protein
MSEISVSICRQGFLILVDRIGCSVTFYPNNKDKTFNALVDKLKDLGSDLSDHERLNIDLQLSLFTFHAVKVMVGI